MTVLLIICYVKLSRRTCTNNDNVVFTLTYLESRNINTVKNKCLDPEKVQQYLIK